MRERVSINFYKDELWCPCCKVYNIENESLQKLQEIRTFLNFPLRINSAYRCKLHNATLKDASKNSQHCLGRAFDVAFRDADDLFLIVSSAIKFGFKGIGIGKTFVHLDNRENSVKMWTY